jgi:hypothetical protein
MQKIYRERPIRLMYLRRTDANTQNVAVAPLSNTTTNTATQLLRWAKGSGDRGVISWNFLSVLNGDDNIVDIDDIVIEETEIVAVDIYRVDDVCVDVHETKSTGGNTDRCWHGRFERGADSINVRAGTDVGNARSRGEGGPDCSAGGCWNCERHFADKVTRTLYIF